LYFIPYFDKFNETFFIAHEQCVYQQIGAKKTEQNSLSPSQFSQKLMQTNKADAMQVLRKITTQHDELINCEIFTGENTEPH